MLCRDEQENNLVTKDTKLCITQKSVCIMVIPWHPYHYPTKPNPPPTQPHTPKKRFMVFWQLFNALFKNQTKICASITNVQMILLDTSDPNIFCICPNVLVVIFYLGIHFISELWREKNILVSHLQLYIGG